MQRHRALRPVGVLEVDGGGEIRGVDLSVHGDGHVRERRVAGVVDATEALDERVGIGLRDRQFDAVGVVLDPRVLAEDGAGDRPRGSAPLVTVPYCCDEVVERLMAQCTAVRGPGHAEHVIGRVVDGGGTVHAARFVEFQEADLLVAAQVGGGRQEDRVRLGAVGAAAACDTGGHHRVPAVGHREHRGVLQAAHEGVGGPQRRDRSGGLGEEDAVVLVQRLPLLLPGEREVHAVRHVGVVRLLLRGGSAVVGGEFCGLVLRQQCDLEGLRHRHLGGALAGDLDREGHRGGLLVVVVQRAAGEGGAIGVDRGRDHSRRSVGDRGAVGEVRGHHVLGGRSLGALLERGAGGHHLHGVLRGHGDPTDGRRGGEGDGDRVAVLVGLGDAAVLGDHVRVAARPGDRSAGGGEGDVVAVDALRGRVQAVEQRLRLSLDLRAVDLGVLGAGLGDLLRGQRPVVDAERGDLTGEERVGPGGAADGVHRLVRDRGGDELGLGDAGQFAVDVEGQGSGFSVEHAGQGVPAVGVEVLLGVGAPLSGVRVRGDRGTGGVPHRGEEVVVGVAFRADVPQEVVVLLHLLVELHLGGDGGGVRLAEQVIGQPDPVAVPVLAASGQAQRGAGPLVVVGVLHGGGLTSGGVGHRGTGSLGERVIDQQPCCGLGLCHATQRQEQGGDGGCDGRCAQQAAASRWRARMACGPCSSSHDVRTPSYLCPVS